MNFQELAFFIRYLGKLVLFACFSNKKRSNHIANPLQFFTANTEVLYLHDDAVPADTIESDCLFLRSKGVTLEVLDHRTEHTTESDHQTEPDTTSTAKQTALRKTVKQLQKLNSIHADILVIRSSTLNSTIRHAASINTPAIRISFGTGISFPFCNVTIPDVDSLLSDHF